MVMKEIKLELLKWVVNQIKLDSEYGDFTAIEELFLKLENRIGLRLRKLVQLSLR